MQTFNDFECLVIDDGSTDKSRGIINKFAKLDKRFIPVFQENRGVSAARNRGLDMARGEYISFLDADDCFYPDAMELLHNLIVQNNAAVAGGGGVQVPNDFILLDVPPLNSTNPLFKVFGNSVTDLMNISSMGSEYRVVWVWRRLFRRDVIGDLRFDEELYPGEDTCFMLEVLPRCGRIVESRAMVVYHRASLTAVSNAVFNQKFFAYITPTMRRIRWIMDAFYPKSFQKWFYKLYMDLVINETIVRSMKHGRLMGAVTDHLRPIYGTRVLPTRYMPWRKRLIFWLFMKVF